MADALSRTSSAWRRAYELEPRTDGDRAVDLLSRGLAEELSNLNSESHCVICDRVVDQAGARRERIYCSPRCRKVASNRSELLDVAA